MGYFSNGTEGEMYAEEYCSSCVHNDACPIWGLHFEHNYSHNKVIRSVLDYLIPRDESGVGNERCRMYHNAEDEPPPAKLPLKGEVVKLNGHSHD